jgi:CheY-like chemotaxis protein
LSVCFSNANSNLLSQIQPIKYWKIVPQTTPQQTIETSSGPSKFILIGEDDIDDQDFLKEVFTSVDNSFHLTFINNGNKLLGFIEDLPDNKLPCLFVMDYNMPGLNGAEILHELKKNRRYSHIPKMIWSTSNSEMYKNICLDLGANDYVIKPSNVKEMEEVVKYMLSFC